MGKSRRSFTREFKVEAVKLVPEQRRSFAEAAANLGIAESLLRQWKKDLDDQGEQAFPGKGNLPALQEELRRLCAENKRLQRERDILPLNTSIFLTNSSRDYSFLLDLVRCPDSR
jgi:transposase